MTGHVRRRGKRSFELKFDAGRDPMTGKRHVRYVSFKGTRRDAEIELARLVSENASGKALTPQRKLSANFLTDGIGIGRPPIPAAKPSNAIVNL